MRGLLIVLVAMMAGCAGGDTQDRYQVSGAVKYDGKPVNFGEVLFTPDATLGNSGAQGIATISNGRYDTKGSRAPGVAAGPVVVRVTALADANGKLICEYEFKMEIQKSSNQHDIDIPVTAGKSAPPSPDI